MDVDEPVSQPTEPGGTGRVSAPDQPDDPTDQSQWHRKALWAAVRAVVVLLIAAAAYPSVVPTRHAERNRMARLVPTRSGLPTYDKATPKAGEQPDTSTKVAAVNAAAKKSPGGTGIYSIEWSPDQTSGAGVIAFLLPTPAAAGTAMGQIESQQLGAKSYSVDQLNRVSTFKVAAVPGSAGSVYHPAKVGGPPGLAVTAFRYGRVVAMDEIANVDATSVQADVEKLTALEYSRLKSVGPNFTLEVTRIPLAGTIAWGVGAVLLAALVSLIPLDRYRRQLNRQKAYEAEMANKVLVGRKVVATKHRR
ncbi:MAG TPA: hypothetical protein VFN68_03955 [Acidimicrobiales bacterium]|nr:hypothetical protein [Acidimicrobiales bacterium]